MLMSLWVNLKYLTKVMKNHYYPTKFKNSDKLSINYHEIPRYRSE